MNDEINLWFKEISGDSKNDNSIYYRYFNRDNYRLSGYCDL